MATVRGFNADGSWAVMERTEFALNENGERIPEIDPETGEQKIRKRIRNGCESSERLWKRITVQTNDWNKREFLQGVKKAWAEQCNRYLPPEQQIDWRSYREQGRNQIPMVHEGPGARQALQQGVIFDTVRENQERRQLNAILARIEQLIRDLRKRLEELRLRFNRWRTEHGQRRSPTAEELIRANGRIATSVSAVSGRNDNGNGARRSIQEMIAAATELSKRTDHVQQRKHRR
jgi:hypothetical protein